MEQGWYVGLSRICIQSAYCSGKRQEWIRCNQHYTNRIHLNKSHEERILFLPKAYSWIVNVILKYYFVRCNERFYKYYYNYVLAEEIWDRFHVAFFALSNPLAKGTLYPYNMRCHGS